MDPSQGKARAKPVSRANPLVRNGLSWGASGALIPRRFKIGTGRSRKWDGGMGHAGGIGFRPGPVDRG